MTCVSSVRYSVKVNGHLLDPFVLTRGLRQGDLLSPSLFLFVADGLSSLITRRIEDASLRDFRITRRSPGISHLLFADDSLLFFQCNTQQALVIRDILASYENCTGQLLSPGKCSILIGKQVPQADGDAVAAILGVTNTTFDEKYLGLPVSDGAMKNGRFQTIKEKAGKRLDDWSEKYLSAGGKEILIKSVIQSLPTFTMSVFKFTKGLCEDLEHITHNFWWGDNIIGGRCTGLPGTS